MAKGRGQSLVVLLGCVLTACGARGGAFLVTSGDAGPVGQRDAGPELERVECDPRCPDKPQPWDGRIQGELRDDGYYLRLRFENCGGVPVSEPVDALLFQCLPDGGRDVINQWSFMIGLEPQWGYWVETTIPWDRIGGFEQQCLYFWVDPEDLVDTCIDFGPVRIGEERCALMPQC